MAVPSPSKAALRDAALAQRRRLAEALDPATRAALEQALADRVLPHLAGAGTVAGYHPLRAEIGVGFLLDRLLPAQNAVLPWFQDRDSRMLWRAGPAIVAGPWGMAQPADDAPALRPDVVLVPLVLADRTGTRIGHGKGHYDRALAHLAESGHRALTIGIGWDEQIAPAPLPRDPWDQPLDAIATPGEWISCG